ncbi:MAG: helix-turn-helix transcriptional regulator [Chryseolinea sp.]
MIQRIYLGELEELVLMMVALLSNDAYGVTIVDALKEKAERNISISAVHAVLHRLEEKRFVKSKMVSGTAERGGRSKRLFKITTYGLSTLEDLRERRDKIWGLISKSSPA